MKKFRKVLLGAFEVILIIYVLIFTTLLVCRNKFGYSVINDKTMVTVNEKNAKNLGQFNTGDLILIEKTDYSKLNNGDEVYFYDTIQNEYVIKKSTVTGKSGEDGSYLVNIDDKRTISGDRVLGTFQNESYSGIGRIIEFLTSRFGFLIFVILPIMLLFIYQIYSLIFLVKESDGKNVKSKKNTIKKDEIETL